MPFEKYDNPHAASNESWVKLRYFQLVISVEAFALIGTPAKMNLYWDAETKRVGIGSADSADTSALRANRYGRHVQVSVTGFMRRHHLPFSKESELFEPELIDSEHGPLLVLDWSEYLARTERQP